MEELVKLIIASKIQPPAEQAIVNEVKAHSDSIKISKGVQPYLDKSSKDENVQNMEDRNLHSTFQVLGEEMVTDPLEVNRPELKNTESSYHEENEVIRDEKKADDFSTLQISQKNDLVLGVSRQELCEWAKSKRKFTDSTLPKGNELKLLVRAFKTSKTFEAKKLGRESHSFKSKRLEEKFGKRKPEEVCVIEKSEDNNSYSYKGDHPDEILGLLCIRVQQVVRDLHWIQVDLNKIRKRVKYD